MLRVMRLWSVPSTPAIGNDAEGISVSDVAPAGDGNLVEANTTSNNAGDGIYAAGRANRLVLEEGLSFRDAYRRVAAELKKPGE